MHPRDKRRVRPSSELIRRAVVDALEPRTLLASAADFTETTVFGGLNEPTAIEFSPDGRVFVAEKSGLIRVFDDLNDTTPTTFADLRTKVHNYWDRGLLGLTLDPQFTTGRPYVYVLYTYDGDLNGSAPKYGSPNTDSDPGASNGTSLVTGRLSRLTASGNQMTGSELVLVHDWQQQYPSHSIGDLQFGPDGYLYASGGDGASFGGVDYGQSNAFNDPTNEGGAVRSQDIRSTGDPVSLDGTVIRINPDTGAPAPGNPFASNADTNAKRIVAYGLRNPYRFSFRPGTSEIYIAETGWNTYEEINRIGNASDSSAENFGWPAYEGPARQSGYDAANLPLLESLYSAGASAHDSPWFAYRHSDKVVAGSSEPTGGSTPTGVMFYRAEGNYPSEYDGAMFFADYARKQIYVMYAGANGQPDQSTREIFRSLTNGAVDLIQGPDGAIYYADLNGDRIRRIAYAGPDDGLDPSYNGDGLAVTYYNNSNFTGSTVSRVDPTISFNWGNGSPDASIGADTFSAVWTGQIRAVEGGTYTFQTTTDDGVRLWVNNTLLIDKWIDQSPTAWSNTINLAAGQSYSIRLEYYENGGGAVATLEWQRPGRGMAIVPKAVLKSAPLANTAPAPTITSPSAGTNWRVGQTLTFAGSATDAEDGALPASGLRWSLVLVHGNEIDPTNTHEHTIQTFTGVAGGSFVAPDHEYPSWIELRLTATDSDGDSTTVSRRLDPLTVQVTLASSPAGAQLTFGDRTAEAPITRTLLVGGSMQISAPAQFVTGGLTYNFAGWSDGGAITHDILGPSAGTTITANYALPPAPGAPGNLQAIAQSSSRIDLSWDDNSSNETGFKIERRGPSSDWTQIATVGANVRAYQNTGLASDTTYDYRVRAEGASGDSAYSNTASATTASVLVAPAQPTNLSASNVASGSLTLNWTDNATNETGYRVQRRPVGGSYATIATLGANAESFDDSGLTPGASYEYRVMAFNAAGDSPASNTVGVTTQSGSTTPLSPESLAATVLAGPSVRLTWQDRSDNETSFVIQRRYRAWIWSDIGTAGANATEYLDTSAIGNVTYEYRVLARNAAGDSGFSNAVEVNTAQVGTVPPAAPSALTAIAVTGTRVDLAWTDNAGDETGFKLERRLAGGAWAQIATPSANATGYSDTTVSAGQTYEYRLRATRSGDDSAYSNTASTTTPGGGTGVPNAPTGLTAVVTTRPNVQLDWADNSTNETAFIIQRRYRAWIWGDVATVGANTTSFLDTTGINNVTYEYRVVAVGPGGSSPFSNGVIVSTA